MAQSWGRLTAILATLAVLVTMAGVVPTACTKPPSAQAVSAGAGVAELVCAVVLEPNGTEREICDTGAKLAELLAKLLAQNTQEATAPMASGAPALSAAPVPPAPRLLNLYVKQPTPASSSSAGGLPSPR